MRLYCISRYRSAIGSWEPGTEIDVKDETAELLLRDSPGSFSFDPPPAVKAEKAEVERATVAGVDALARPQRKGVSR